MPSYIGVSQKKLWWD